MQFREAGLLGMPLPVAVFVDDDGGAVDFVGDAGIQLSWGVKPHTSLLGVTELLASHAERGGGGGSGGGKEWELKAFVAVRVCGFFIAVRDRCFCSVCALFANSTLHQQTRLSPRTPRKSRRWSCTFAVLTRTPTGASVHTQRPKGWCLSRYGRSVCCICCVLVASAVCCVPSLLCPPPRPNHLQKLGWAGSARLCDTSRSLRSDFLPVR